MFSHRRTKMMRMEILLFGLGCLGTVVFAWSMNSANKPADISPEGAYSFAVSMPDDLEYLQNMKSPEAFNTEADIPLNDVSLYQDVAEKDVSTSDVTSLPIVKEEEQNPYMNVD